MVYKYINERPGLKYTMFGVFLAGLFIFCSLMYQSINQSIRVIRHIENNDQFEKDQFKEALDYYTMHFDDSVGARRLH